MKKSGFTLMEVIISCVILALFMGSVMVLYTNGGKISSSTMWIQNTTNKLKLASRLINTCITKSSYPSVMEFPNGIRKNTGTAFDIHYATSVTAGENSRFLIITEAVPAETGKGSDKVASISYHVFSLKNRDLIYERHHENKTPEDTETMTDRTTTSGNRQYQTKLIGDVESIRCDEIENSANNKLLKVTITCHMPRSNTVRTEETIGVPNVTLVQGDLD